MGDPTYRAKKRRTKSKLPRVDTEPRGTDVCSRRQQKWSKKRGLNGGSGEASLRSDASQHWGLNEERSSQTASCGGSGGGHPRPSDCGDVPVPVQSALVAHILDDSMVGSIGQQPEEEGGSCLRRLAAQRLTIGENRIIAQQLLGLGEGHFSEQQKLFIVGLYARLCELEEDHLLAPEAKGAQAFLATIFGLHRSTISEWYSIVKVAFLRHVSDGESPEEFDITAEELVESLYLEKKIRDGPTDLADNVQLPLLRGMPSECRVGRWRGGLSTHHVQSLLRFMEDCLKKGGVSSLEIQHFLKQPPPKDPVVPDGERLFEPVIISKPTVCRLLDDLGMRYTKVQYYEKNRDNPFVQEYRQWYLTKAPAIDRNMLCVRVTEATVQNRQLNYVWLDVFTDESYIHSNGRMQFSWLLPGMKPELPQTANGKLFPIVAFMTQWGLVPGTSFVFQAKAQTGSGQTRKERNTKKTKPGQEAVGASVAQPHASSTGSLVSPAVHVEDVEKMIERLAEDSSTSIAGLTEREIKERYHDTMNATLWQLLVVRCILKAKEWFENGGLKGKLEAITGQNVDFIRIRFRCDSAGYHTTVNEEVGIKAEEYKTRERAIELVSSPEKQHKVPRAFRLTEEEAKKMKFVEQLKPHCMKLRKAVMKTIEKVDKLKIYKVLQRLSQDHPETPHEVFFTPAYAPQFQPIELLWSLIKRHIYKNLPPGLKRDQVIDTVHRALASVEHTHMAAMIRHCAEAVAREAAEKGIIENNDTDCLSAPIEVQQNELDEHDFEEEQAQAQAQATGAASHAEQLTQLQDTPLHTIW